MLRKANERGRPPGDLPVAGGFFLCYNQPARKRRIGGASERHAEDSMKEALKRIVEKFHQYNSEHMAAQTFGLREDIVYDALVVAPSFTPHKLHLDERLHPGKHAV